MQSLRWLSFFVILPAAGAMAAPQAPPDKDSASAAPADAKTERGDPKHGLKPTGPLADEESYQTIIHLHVSLDCDLDRLDPDAPLQLQFGNKRTLTFLPVGSEIDSHDGLTHLTYAVTVVLPRGEYSAGLTTDSPMRLLDWNPNPERDPFSPPSATNYVRSPECTRHLREFQGRALTAREQVRAIHTLAHAPFVVGPETPWIHVQATVREDASLPLPNLGP